MKSVVRLKTKFVNFEMTWAIPTEANQLRPTLLEVIGGQYTPQTTKYATLWIKDSTKRPLFMPNRAQSVHRLILLNELALYTFSSPNVLSKITCCRRMLFYVLYQCMVSYFGLYKGS